MAAEGARFDRRAIWCGLAMARRRFTVSVWRIKKTQALSIDFSKAKASFVWIERPEVLLLFSANSPNLPQLKQIFASKLKI